MNTSATHPLTGTKAETLDYLSGCLQHAKVLPQVRFSRPQWQADDGRWRRLISEQPWGKQPLIVRSSALSEDALGGSMAGHYTSVANVSGGAALAEAVETVLRGFPDDGLAHQVFIQPLLQDVTLSGVAFTRDPRNAGHYYVINYDALSGATDSVTSGRSNTLETLYLSKRHCLADDHPLQGLLPILRELETLYGSQALDVEFAQAGHDWYVLQVRPLVLNRRAALSETEHHNSLQRVYDKISRFSRPHPYLQGSRTLFGVMPDWNPAEIIGIRPRPLALSTYKELVTDSVWAYQRHNYGYRNLRSFPLLVDFAGLPYIDVRVSFNSFIPADIEQPLANRLVNEYMDRLVESPIHHDKVEFEIIYSCYTLDLQERLQSLRTRGFSAQDCKALADSLRRLTNRIIHSQGLWTSDLARLNKLSERHHALMQSDLPRLEKIYWLLEDCKRYGTLPFAGLARAGFIAVQLLKSLVSVGVLREQDYECFMASLDTVSSQLAHDKQRYSRAAFLQHYGHLRPGTYDITSARYDEQPDLYFNWANMQADTDDGSTATGETRNARAFALSLAQMNRLQTLLEEHRLEHGVLSLLNFIKAAIEGRERAKFMFTRNLSDALQYLGDLGAELGFSRDDLSYLDIDVIQRLYGSADDVAKVLQASIAAGRERYESTQQLALPPLITSPDDVFGFQMPVEQPNFVTLQSVVAPKAEDCQPDSDLAGRIVMIPSADPGFDWLFSRGIGGLITMFGGVNSHMAIRAGELAIPAVIGAGETLYRRWEQGRVLSIDCARQQVMVLQ